MTTKSQVSASDFFEKREDDRTTSRKSKVIIRKMTKEQARQVFPYRPYSKYSESFFGGDTLYDDVCLLLNGLAIRCKMCMAPTKKEYLEEGICPDCDGRSEYNGTDPHKQVN